MHGDAEEEKKMFYKLVVSRLEAGRAVNVNIFEMRNPVQVLRQLAICFREANKKTRKNSAIIKAAAWETYAANGAPVNKFAITLKYDENNTYLYEYEFQSCGLE